ncbi:immune-associated nucleotide-binding protein 7-like [Gouania willdenowi]|uniref:Immune-associated nucleotide-binding protein 7-like n=1 Tax=Gouania willdenowi TaxID=441366 RepID=A0A8C5N8T9_GOUWI|nr:immune-associated nucleotide-binding protein 7-like [Gouania willdenowi]
MECQCDREASQDAASGWWMGTNSVQMGAFTVVGYLLYRFSQTLPALIRWPIRIFCSLTGLTALWGWVSRLVGTLRGIQSLCKWLSRVWRFIVGFCSKFKWLSAAVRAITGSSDDESSKLSTDPSSSVRLILLGPSDGGRTSLAHALFGIHEIRPPKGGLVESTVRRAVVDGRDLTVVDTPDLLGPSMGNGKRAREALRSLQLTSPGPHAFMLVMPTSSTLTAQLMQAIVELYGDGVLEYIIPVLTHAEPAEGGGPDVDAGPVKQGLSLCGQRPELVENQPDRSPETLRVLRQRLLGRVVELRETKDLFIHEIHREEERLREDLLNDMASSLTKKLKHT